jgi:hypothetical protein
VLIRRPHKKRTAPHSTAQHRTKPHKTAEGPHKDRTRSAHEKKCRKPEEMSMTNLGNLDCCTCVPKFAVRIIRHVPELIYRMRAAFS